MASFFGFGSLCYTIGNGLDGEALCAWAATAALLAIGKGRDWRNLEVARRQLEQEPTKRDPSEWLR